MSSNKNVDEKRNIKNYNHYLWIFILVNFSIFLCISLGKEVNINNINTLYKNLTVKDGVVIAVSTLITFIFNGILPSNLKYVLVFWRIKNPLPSSRIFTKLIDKDCRIDKLVLIKKYGVLPFEADAQSKLWYKIYKPNEFDPMIFESQRSFLLSRDLTGISFLALIIFPISTVMLGIKISSVFIYIGFLLVQYIVLSVACQNYGNRFACNALAIACIKK